MAEFCLSFGILLCLQAHCDAVLTYWDTSMEQIHI